jgi:hypothetical protein
LFFGLRAARGSNDALAALFGVDGIPHLALVAASGDVETALIGLVPTEVY